MKEAGWKRVEIPFYKILYKWNCHDWKQVSGLSEGGVVSGPEETFGSDGCVHYTDCGDVFMDAYLWQNLLNYTLKYMQLTQ